MHKDSQLPSAARVSTARHKRRILSRSSAAPPARSAPRRNRRSRRELPAELRSLIFPALLPAGASPGALKSEPHPCAAFAAGRDRRTRAERSIFVIDSPSSQQTTACRTSRCINSAFTLLTHQFSARKFAPRKNYIGSKSEIKKIQRIAGTEQTEESVDKAVG